MKHPLLIFFVTVFSWSSIVAQPSSVPLPSPNNEAYFNTAYNEITAMLDGKSALSIKRAVFLLEWAYLDGKLDYATYCAEIDRVTKTLKDFIKLNNLDKNPIGGNMALFEFFTNPNPLNDYKSYDYDFEDYCGEEDFTKNFVTKLMRTHRGQCRSLPLFYKILADDEFMQNIKTQLIDINEKIVATGYADMPKHLYDAWVKSFEEQQQRQKQENNH